MIFGNKEQIEKALPFVGERLQKALRYLAATDFSKLPNGEYELDGRTIYASVNTYLTECKTCKKPEAHNKYIDVQFLGRGTETIYYHPRSAAIKMIEDYAKERDLLFFEQIDESNAVTMQAGDFVVLFPWELHRPGCNAGAKAAEVQKIVVKVLLK